MTEQMTSLIVQWMTGSPLIGVSLSEPHIDHDNGLCARNNGIYVSIYLCLYHLPCVCCTLVPEICVHPEMLRVFWYIDVLTCVIYNCTPLNSKDDWSYSCLP